MENKYRDLSDLPMILRVEDLMPILGIGRNTAYELIRSGQIRSVRIGRQIRIPREALLEFLEGGVTSYDTGDDLQNHARSDRGAVCH